MILFLFLSTILFSPENSYYPTINAAELAIADGNYELAMQQYDAAFAVQPIPLAQDLYNASLCAIQLNNPEKSMSLCLQLADKGVPVSFFSKKSSYASIRKNTHWTAFVQEAEERQAAFKERNKDNLALLNGLLTRSDKVYKDYQMNPRSEYALNEYRWAGDSLCKIVLGYLQQTGYLSEEQFGVAILRDTVLNARPVFARIMDRRPLLVNVHLDTLFRRLFYQQGVNSGKLKPEQAAELTYGRMDLREGYAAHYFVLYGKNLYHSTSIATTQAATIRQHLGLPRLEDELVKIRSAIPAQPNGFLFSIFLKQQRSVNELAIHEQQFLQAHTLTINNIAPDGP